MRLKYTLNDPRLQASPAHLTARPPHMLSHTFLHFYISYISLLHAEAQRRAGFYFSSVTLISVLVKQ